MSIVLGTTLRRESQSIADLAGKIARRLNTSLRLVHVSEDPRAPVVLGTDEEYVLGSIRDDLRREAERIHAVTSAEIQPHLAAGSPVDALVAIAQWEQATILVLGARPWPSRGSAGGIAERVSLQSRVPVLTVNDPEPLLKWIEGETKLRVLIGADLGRAAVAARAFGASLNPMGSAETEVVLVASAEETHGRLGLPPPEREHVMSAEAESVLMRELERQKPPLESGARFRIYSARGSADAHLVAIADRENFDLIVVGQRPGSMLGRFRHASVAQGVMRASPVSVACVPAVSLGAGTPIHPPKVIVAATDFSEAGNHAASYAMGLSGTAECIHVAHVVDTAANEKERQMLRDQAWYNLLKIGSEPPVSNSVRIEQHLLEGNAPEQLLSLAERVGADVIVLGTRSRPALSRALLGSVAQGLSEHSKVPVLLVPMPRA